MTGGEVPYRWDVVDSIHRIDPEEWNRLVERAGGSMFQSHEWLAMYEDAPPGRLLGVHHVVARSKSGLVAVVPLFHLGFEALFDSYQADHGFEHDLLHRSQLLSHSWYAFYTRFCSPLAPAEVLVPVCGIMREIAEEVGASVYGFQGIEVDDPASAQLGRLGFAAARTEPTSRLALRPEDGLDGYLRSLRQSPRSDLVRLGRRARRLGASVSWERDDRHVEALAALVRDVCEKHGAPVSYPLETLRSIFRRLGSRIHLGSLWHDGAMLGAMLSVAHGGALWGWIAGLDYSRNREFGTYYALYLLSIERALQLGVRRLEAGRGQYRIKVRLGFTPTPLRAWMQAGPGYDQHELARGMALLERCTDAPGKVRDAYRAANLTPPADLVVPVG